MPDSFLLFPQRRKSNTSIALLKFLTKTMQNFKRHLKSMGQADNEIEMGYIAWTYIWGSVFLFLTDLSPSLGID